MSGVELSGRNSPDGSALLSYPKFLRQSLALATDGSLGFYAWMTMLTAISLVGANAWAHQVAEGMIGTNMTDHVSWGLYIANFTFCVGLAAGGVMMVIPAYLYDDEEMHKVVIIGEAVAIAAIVMCTLSVMVDLGRPDRFWHMIPGIGRFNWPISMLTWDIIVLNGYLLINLHIVGYLLYMRYLGRHPNPSWYVPFVFLSIVWAISIHTVTAFLYCGLGGRPFWNTALLAPRFLASAFVSGPAFIILVMRILRITTGYSAPPGPAKTLIQIIRVAMVINLLMLASELFTLFYTGGSHGASAQVPVFWKPRALRACPLDLDSDRVQRSRRDPVLHAGSSGTRVAANHSLSALHRGNLDRKRNGADHSRLYPIHVARNRGVLAKYHRMESDSGNLGIWLAAVDLDAETDLISIHRSTERRAFTSLGRLTATFQSSVTIRTLLCGLFRANNGAVVLVACARDFHADGQSGKPIFGAGSIRNVTFQTLGCQPDLSRVSIQSRFFLIANFVGLVLRLAR